MAQLLSRAKTLLLKSIVSLPKHRRPFCGAALTGEKISPTL
jgi:hypothetical protein